MPFAVHLFFDATTEATIKSVWKELADTGIAPYLHQSANRPHLTLAIYQDLDLSESKRRLNSWTAQVSFLPLVFQHLGIFSSPKAVIFLGPTVTTPLLDLHSQIHQMLGDIGTYPSVDYYLPEHWVPHCALAMEMGPILINSALAIGLQLILPLQGQIMEIGVIEFRPVKHLFCFRLMNLPSDPQNRTGTIVRANASRFLCK